MDISSAIQEERNRLLQRKAKLKQDKNKNSIEIEKLKSFQKDCANLEGAIFSLSKRIKASTSELDSITSDLPLAQKYKSGIEKSVNLVGTVSAAAAIAIVIAAAKAKSSSYTAKNLGIDSEISFINHRLSALSLLG